MTTHADETDSFSLAFTRSDGVKLVGLASRPRAHKARGLAIIAPAFSKRMHHFGPLSRAFVRAGWATLRYDAANHVGLSEGAVRDFTLSSMVRDLEAAADAALGSRHDLPTFVIATSLSSRAAIRFAAHSKRVRGLVLATPVVDVPYSLECAIGFDAFRRWHSGMVEPGSMGCVLGHEVQWTFVQDALRFEFGDTGQTANEVAAITCPVTAIVGSEDEWVTTESVRQALALETSHARRLVILEGASHDFGRNPPLMRSFLEEASRAVTGQPDAELTHLTFQEVIETVRIENTWARERYANLPKMPAQAVLEQ